MNAKETFLDQETSLLKCIGAILRDNVSSTTSGQWRAAFEAGGRAVGINADRIQKPLGPLAELDRERLNVFFDGAIAGKKGKSTSRQGSVLQAFTSCWTCTASRAHSRVF